jgi:C-terminal processing protease CtpA/Prc
MGNSGLRLTTAKFYSPFGRPFSGVGVEPDVTVARTHVVARPDLDQDRELAAATDDTLDAAIRELRTQLAARSSNRAGLVPSR